MSYDPIKYLGLSCPSGGSFYICQDSKVRFLGCCDVNPCGEDEGECPSSAIHPGSFDANKYYEIPAESCASSLKPASWYTCQRPTFLGCCLSNPCNNKGICPDDDLVGARLDDDLKKASVFLTATSASTSNSSTYTTSTDPTNGNTLTPTPTATPTSTPSPPPAPAIHGNSGVSIGGVVGGVLGSLAVLGLIAFIFFRYRKRNRGAIPMALQNEDQIASLRPPWSQHRGEASPITNGIASKDLNFNPFLDLFCDNSTVTTAVSPLSATSAYHRSISDSLFSSIIGFNRSSAAKSRVSHASYDTETTSRVSPRTVHDDGLSSSGLLNPVVELESLPLGGMPLRNSLHDHVHYELEGSIPNTKSKDSAS
ncbi:hypothetical protein F5Y19DRAFT_478887 [Xylariaceae sp. FL1651]|nr:hypothetical protein F5Y19DRAFT_478887 [Xylariaceae sp. FL1651]